MPVLVATWCSLACAAAPQGAERDTPTPEIVEVVYQQGLKKGWADFGWAPRKKNPNGPELLNLKGRGGWILTRTQPLTGAQPGGFTFVYLAPREWGAFLVVSLDRPGSPGRDWQRVRVGPKHQRALPSGAYEVFIPMGELNPQRQPFDRVMIEAAETVPSGWVAIDEVGFTAAEPAEGSPTTEPPKASTPVRTPQRMFIACQRKAHAISPHIYGIAFYPMWEYRDDHHWALKPTGRRWGGNHTSRYNHRLGDAWSAGSDFFFRNLAYLRPGWSWETFLESNAQHGVESVISLPMIGWVAKDTTSFSYPISEFPLQQAHDAATGAGNGKDNDGKWLLAGPATKTSVEADPAFIAAWAKAIRAKADQLHTPVRYILDNEPALWDSTHHDVHPEPLSYDELWARTKAYASAVKRADPKALIAGPAEWGWSNYFYSQKDLKNGGPKVRIDRRAHADVPLIPWYLQRLTEYERQTKTRLVDILDVHFYPQSDVGHAETGDIDEKTALRRIRSTRGLWDPSYRDESWIDEPIYLIPRLKKWVRDNAPGLGVSIGEWNFGAENHISGGLAVAEALGRFGQQDLTSAYYWAYPPDGSAAYWAFRAYRDFDGKGAQFEKWHLPTTAPAGTSAFVSISDDGLRLVAVVLNLDPRAAVDTDFTLQGCHEVASRRAFAFAEGSKALEPVPWGAPTALTLAPFSLSVLEWRLKP